jgi:hypothetical protein
MSAEFWMILCQPYFCLTFFVMIELLYNRINLLLLTLINLNPNQFPLFFMQSFLMIISLMSSFSFAFFFAFSITFFSPSCFSSQGSDGTLPCGPKERASVIPRDEHGLRKLVCPCSCSCFFSCAPMSMCVCVSA